VLTEDIEQTNDTLQTVTIIKNGNQVIETKKSTNVTNGKIVKDKDGNLIKID